MDLSFLFCRVLCRSGGCFHIYSRFPLDRISWCVSKLSFWFMCVTTNHVIHWPSMWGAGATKVNTGRRSRLDSLVHFMASCQFTCARVQYRHALRTQSTPGYLRHQHLVVGSDRVHVINEPLQGFGILLFLTMKPYFDELMFELTKSQGEQKRTT